MINLGDKNWGVKDSGLLAYKQVGSKYFNKDFDFTRASSGTYIDKNGVLQTAEVYNLVPYSNDFSQWATRALSSVNNNIVVSPSGNLNGSSLIEDNTTNFHWVQNIVSITASSTTTISVFAKAKDTRNLFIRSYDSAVNVKVSQFNILNGTIISTDSGSTSSIEDVGNGWYRCSQTRADISGGGSMTCQIGILNGTSIEYAGDGISGIYIYGAQLVEGTEARDYQYTNGRVGIPRVDFSDGVGALLLEPQKSNLLLQSNSFDTTWFNIFSTEEGGYSGIYGSNNAWLVTKNNSSGYIGQSISQGGITTFSVYVKANDSSWVELICDGGAYRFFNLSDGTLGSGNGIDDKIESVENGWYRCSIVQNASITRVRIRLAEGNNDTSGTSGSIYIQHAQLESGYYPTSIIETTTSQVTRTADVANNCGTEQDFNSEEGVLYAEIARGGDANDDYELISIMDSTQTIRLGFGKRGNSTEWYIRAIIDSLSINVSGVSFEEGFQKIAFKYKSGDSAVWLNGVEIYTNTTSFTTNLNFSELIFNWTSSNFPFYGKVRSVKYFPTALTDDELQNLTTL
jgi:hypothetical protein